MTMFLNILPMPSLDRSVVAVAYDGLCAFEFGVATELFGLARPELGVDWYDFAVVSADTGPLRTVGGVTLATSNDLSKVERAGTIVLPGWRDPGEVPQAELLEAIRVGHTNGARVMSICSGVFVLAATGLLDGQQATTHWRYAERLAELYPRIEVFPDVLYIDNGTTLTSAGSAAGIDLGLHLAIFTPRLRCHHRQPGRPSTRGTPAPRWWTGSIHHPIGRDHECHLVGRGGRLGDGKPCRPDHHRELGRSCQYGSSNLRPSL